MAKQSKRHGNLLIISSESQNDIYGGVGRHILETIDLLRADWNVQLLSIPSYSFAETPKTGSITRDATNQTVQVINPNFINCLRCSVFDAHAYDRSCEEIFVSLKNDFQDVDVVMVQDAYAVGVALRLVERLRVRRFIVFSHLPLSSRFSYFDKGGSDKCQQALESVAFISADKIVVPSKAAARAVSAIYPIRPERIVVIPLGVRAPRSLPGSDPREAHIVTVGRFTEQKGWDVFTRVFHELSAVLPNLSWTLVGKGPLLHRTLKEMRRSDNVQKVTHYSKLDPRTELINTISAHRVFFLPTTFETFGLSPLEAASVGTVPVVTDIGPLAEIWGDSGLTFEPGDIEAPTNTLIDLATNFHFWRSHSIRARQIASVYTWERHVEALCSVLSGDRL